MSNFNKRISDTACRLGEVRFSYPNVFAKRTNPDGTPGKYSVCVIFPKTDNATYQTFFNAYEGAKNLGKQTKWGGKLPAKVALPLHDGDDERPDDPAFAGCWFFNCSSNNAPGVAIREADGTIGDALDSDDFYAGCYGAVTINMFPYSVSGNVGVGVGLNNVIKTRDGERLGGGRSAAADFADL